MMSRQLIPIYHESNPTPWITTALPTIQIRAVAQIDHKTWLLLLLSESDATDLKQHLTTGIVPPFNRRPLTTPGRYAPGLAFAMTDFTALRGEERKNLVAALRAMLAGLIVEGDYMFVRQIVRSMEDGSSMAEGEGEGIGKGKAKASEER